MFQKARETSYLESTSIFVLLLRWRKPVIICVLLTAIAAVIFSGPYFITPKYKSTVVFFPASTNSVSKALMDDNTTEKQDILAFGEEEQAEQMLQILNSDEIRGAIIRKYDLMNHYKIDKAGLYPMTELYKEYNDNIHFSRTEFLSVKIEVLDSDPQTAAAIANDIASLVDSVKTRMQNQRAAEALAIMETAYKEKQHSITLKEDSLKKLRELGVMNYKDETAIWNSEYAKSFAAFNNERAALSVLRNYKNETDSAIVNTRARIEGARARMESLKHKLDVLAQYGGASVSLNEELTLDRTEASRLREQLEKLRLDVNQNLTQKFIVNKAEKAEKKSYPERWLIVLVSVIGSLFLCLVVILGIERLKEIQFKL
ncbi:MAG: hypothetical protein IT242_01835 [Bacteroidia bacterium]|nr:hypothetical protein [Bacteroidia bacterium]